MDLDQKQFPQFTMEFPSQPQKLLDIMERNLAKALLENISQQQQQQQKKQQEVPRLGNPQFYYGSQIYQTLTQPQTMYMQPKMYVNMGATSQHAVMQPGLQGATMAPVEAPAMNTVQSLRGINLIMPSTSPSVVPPENQGLVGKVDTPPATPRSSATPSPGQDSAHSDQVSEVRIAAESDNTSGRTSVTSLENMPVRPSNKLTELNPKVQTGTKPSKQKVLSATPGQPMAEASTISSAALGKKQSVAARLENVELQSQVEGRQTVSAASSTTGESAEKNMTSPRPTAASVMAKPAPLMASILAKPQSQ
uniref:Uncharacterized protein n=1 Tax=Timema poppense TaxID=170557 RepID=A0A7R9D5R8_TIMPO|nr:unnamed protein product [Timema poppensis]